MQPVHEEQQQLLGVLLVVASKLLVDLADGDLEVSRADALVQTGPQRLHDHAKLLCHLPFMTKDVLPGRGRQQGKICSTFPASQLILLWKVIPLLWALTC